MMPTRPDENAAGGDVLELLAAAARQDHPAPVIAAAGQPSYGMAFAGLAVALVLILGLWEITGHVSTIAHEGAHVVGMILFERGVSRVIVDYKNDAHEGKTVPPTGTTFFSVLATIVGYMGPPLFGLMGAALLIHGSATGTLWVFLVLLGGLILFVRNLFGILVVGAVGTLFYLTLTYGSAQAQVLVACTWVWLLLILGLMFAIGHFGGGGDHEHLQDRTLISKYFWGAISVVVATIALWYGGAWLLGFSHP
jgi:hypothetical protein